MGKKSSGKLIGALSVIFSRLIRPIRNMNITKRTDKVLSKDKPNVAPQYPEVTKQKELVDEMYPNFMEDHNKKNIQLDNYLKKVYVTSKDPMELQRESNSSKLLPQRRFNIIEAAYYENVHQIPESKCSLQDAIYFITMHNTNRDEYTVEKIAVDYKLDKQVVVNILKYFEIPVIMNTKEDKDKKPEGPTDKELYKLLKH